MSAAEDSTYDSLSYAESETTLPMYLVNLKESLYVDLCKLQIDIAEITRKTRWTLKEAADIAGCSVKTVQEAIDKGMLKTGTSKWIARPQLEEWLGFDPVEETILRARKLERQIREITEDIARHLETMEDRLKGEIQADVKDPAA